MYKLPFPKERRSAIGESGQVDRAPAGSEMLRCRAQGLLAGWNQVLASGAAPRHCVSAMTLHASLTHHPSLITHRSSSAGKLPRPRTGSMLLI
jgi:hypothetical protein